MHEVGLTRARTMSERLQRQPPAKTRTEYPDPNSVFSRRNRVSAVPEPNAVTKYSPSRSGQHRPTPLCHSPYRQPFLMTFIRSGASKSHIVSSSEAGPILVTLRESTNGTSTTRQAVNANNTCCPSAFTEIPKEGDASAAGPLLLIPSECGWSGRRHVPVTKQVVMTNARWPARISR
jgi:hypothetical protein